MQVVGPFQGTFVYLEPFPCRDLYSDSILSADLASLVARSLSWTLSDDKLSCKISAFFCAIKHCSRVKIFHCAKWHKLSVCMLEFRPTHMVI
jgi:hypothetical protein